MAGKPHTISSLTLRQLCVLSTIVVLMSRHIASESYTDQPINFIYEASVMFLNDFVHPTAR